jgi:hypothetical protein
MNPPAIEIFIEHGIDLYTSRWKLPFAPAQHGGFAVDVWWQSTVKRTFVIGEMAGTHGSTSGGAALNAGQGGGAAGGWFIANVYPIRFALRRLTEGC